MSTFQPNWASKPGNTILDILRERNISTESFVEQMRQPADCVHALIYGEDEISDSTATQLTKVLGASTQFWLNRQQQYRDSLLFVEETEQRKWLKAIPFKEMKTFGWIGEVEEPLKACLNFFGVKTIEEWAKQYNSEIVETVSFRTSQTFKSRLAPLSCWLRQGEIIANTIECNNWNPVTFEQSLSQIKQLTREKNPKKFIPKLISICAASGVAVAIVRTPKGCMASGATKFLPDGRALLMLSFRYLSDDQFWFTFFHEAGHLLMHSNKNVFLEGIESEVEDFEIYSRIHDRENEANDFAGQVLIPPHLQERLSKLRGNNREIISFAKEAGVSPGIVVGQMQHFKYVKRSYLNSFKRRYEWKEILSA